MEFNKTHSHKIPEKNENKSGYDYFTNQNIAFSVTKKLGYEIKDMEEAKVRM